MSIKNTREKFRSIAKSLRWVAVVGFLGLLMGVQSAQSKDYVGGNFQLKDPLDTPSSYCFDLFGFAMDIEPSEVISVHSCKSVGWPDATFRVDYPKQGQIYAIDHNLCVQATNYSRGAHLIMQPCSDTYLQRFVYQENQTVELYNNSGTQKLCMVVNPADGIQIGGGGLHLRREVYLYGCDGTDLKYAQWLIPEGDDSEAMGLAEPENRPTPPEAAPQALGQAFYTSACSRCHGAQGEGRADMHAPNLAGLPAWSIKKQFYNFTNGARGTDQDGRWAGQMGYHLSTMPDRRLAGIDEGAVYVANLPEANIEHTVQGDVAKGKEIYDTSCAACHGSEGLGNEALSSSRLAGVNDWYLLKQMQKFQDGRRGAHPDDTFGAQMVPFAKALNDEATKNVISYINAL